MPAKEPLDYATLTEQAIQETNVLLEKEAPPPLPTPAEKAQNLRANGVAPYLYGSMASLLGEAFDVATFKVYLDGFLKEAGAPTDPVERLLLEQLLLAHHVVGRLHVRAGTRDNLDEIKAYHAAVARLMAEFRRTALALQTYRGGTTGQKPPRGAKPRPAPGAEHAPVNANEHVANGEVLTSDSELTGTNRVNGFFHEHEPAQS